PVTCGLLAFLFPIFYCNGCHFLYNLFPTTLSSHYPLPSPGVPEFVSVGYVDGNLISRYDSETRRMVPRTSWVEKNLHREFWDKNTRIAQGSQQINRMSLDTVRGRYNQSGSGHTRQRMVGYDIHENGTFIKGVYQTAFDGQDFMALDTDTMTLTAADEAAQITKRKWDADRTVAEHVKHYLENTCVEWLRKYVSYGRAVLERKEPPTVQVSGKEADGFLTLYCRAYGFYPRPIAVSWLKGGEVRDQETERGSVAPNSDGTYYTWASIEAHLEEKDEYRCRVEHASLPEPRLFTWGEPGGLGHGERWAGLVALPLLTALLSPRAGVQPGGHLSVDGHCRPGCLGHHHHVHQIGHIEE
uniref:Ig-like domain-containing protein n=1 Tax=Athene cunicularia TaxID=194338 RepID=A0A663MYC6_ATHCN